MAMATFLKRKLRGLETPLQDKAEENLFRNSRYVAERMSEEFASALSLGEEEGPKEGLDLVGSMKRVKSEAGASLCERRAFKRKSCLVPEHRSQQPPSRVCSDPFSKDLPKPLKQPRRSLQHRHIVADIDHLNRQLQQSLALDNSTSSGNRLSEAEDMSCPGAATSADNSCRALTLYRPNSSLLLLQPGLLSASPAPAELLQALHSSKFSNPFGCKPEDLSKAIIMLPSSTRVTEDPFASLSRKERMKLLWKAHRRRDVDYYDLDGISEDDEDYDTDDENTDDELQSNGGLDWIQPVGGAKLSPIVELVDEEENEEEEEEDGCDADRCRVIAMESKDKGKEKEWMYSAKAEELEEEEEERDGMYSGGRVHRNVEEEEEEEEEEQDRFPRHSQPAFGAPSPFQPGPFSSPSSFSQPFSPTLASTSFPFPSTSSSTSPLCTASIRETTPFSQPPGSSFFSFSNPPPCSPSPPFFFTPASTFTSFIPSLHPSPAASASTFSPSSSAFSSVH